MGAEIQAQKAKNENKLVPIIITAKMNISWNFVKLNIPEASLNCTFFFDFNPALCDFFFVIGKLKTDNRTCYFLVSKETATKCFPNGYIHYDFCVKWRHKFHSLYTKESLCKFGAKFFACRFFKIWYKKNFLFSTSFKKVENYELDILFSLTSD